MPKPLRATAPVPVDALAARNAAHIPRYWMLLTPAEAHDLAEGRVPEQVQRMASWLCEPLEEMLTRKQTERETR